LILLVRERIEKKGLEKEKFQKRRSGRKKPPYLPKLGAKRK